MCVEPLLSAVGVLAQGKGIPSRRINLRLTPPQTYREIKTGSTEFPYSERKVYRYFLSFYFRFKFPLFKIFEVETLWLPEHRIAAKNIPSVKYRNTAKGKYRTNRQTPAL